MRYVLPAVLILLLCGIAVAVTVEEVVKLSKLKSSDELILEVIQKEGLDRPITTKDILYLKEQEVSDRVIRYMMRISEAGKTSLPPQEGESEMVSDNLRAYYTTTKDGKKVRVITNLDESGKRMGGELPPVPEPEKAERAPKTASDRDVRIVIEPPRYQDPGPEYTPEEWQKYGLADYYRRYEPIPEIPEYDYTSYPYYESYVPYAPYYSYPYYGRKHGRYYGSVDNSLQGKVNEFLSGPNYPAYQRPEIGRQPQPRRPSYSRQAKSSSAGTKGRKPK